MMNNYRYDICGCYLDPGEGRICDECRNRAEEHDKIARRMVYHLCEAANGQYEMEDTCYGNY